MLRPRRARTRSGRPVDLSADELDWLKQYGMRLGRLAPEEIEAKFVEMGLVRQKLGGMGLTDQGRLALRKR